MKKIFNIPPGGTWWMMLALAVTCSSWAQENRQAFLERVAQPRTTKGWIDFQPANDLNIRTLFLEHSTEFGLSRNDEMRIFREQNDELGFTHLRYQQYHKGLKVIGAEVLLHHNGTYLKGMNGHYATDLDLDITPIVSKREAFDLAKSKVPAEIYVWEHPAIADKLSQASNGQKDFSKPEGELVICRKDWAGDFSPENLTPAWLYRIIVLPMHESSDLYIDAKTGEVLMKMPLSTNCNNNTGNTSFYGSKSFNAGWYGWPNNTWFLESHCSGEATMRSLRGDPLILYNYGDADGSWTDPDGTNGYNQRAGVTTYWCMHKAYDYYRFNHGRLSYDGGNGQLDAFSEITGGLWLSSAENASWNIATHHMSFGAGLTASAADDWNTLDIVGHELTHGVHQWTVGFNYSFEPGALDESFADIFGECAEAYAKGTPLPDFLMGADRLDIKRSFINPNIYIQPDTYYGLFWQLPSNSFDNYGVHTNSGVQNHWFYLLTVGASGTNDNGENYSVSGIGLVNARNIAYRNMDLYLTSSSGYFDSREGSLRAAQDLFGSCSNEMLQVARAWYAVGVATASPDWDAKAVCGNTPLNYVLWGVNTASNNGTCTSVVQPGMSSVFKAGNSVTLYIGFHAMAGSNFTAKLDSCSEVAYNRVGAFTESQGESTEQPSAYGNQTRLLKVFPNPVRNELSVLLETDQSPEELDIALIDITGRINRLSPTALMTDSKIKQFKFDVAENRAGIYFLRIRDRNGTISQKIVINPD